MNMARKIFPSQRRYMDENPAITFRMKKEEKERIVQMADRSGKSVSELVRIALLDLEKNFTATYDKISNQEHRSGFDLGHNQGYKKGWDEGYDKGRIDWTVWSYCYKCGKSVYIMPNSEDHTCMIDRMTGYLSHPNCSFD